MQKIAYFYQKEVAALIEEIDRVADQTTYNGQTVLDGSFTNKSIQVGTEKGQKITFSVDDINANAIGTAAVAEVTAVTAVAEGDVLTAAVAEVVEVTEVVDAGVTTTVGVAAVAAVAEVLAGEGDVVVGVDAVAAVTESFCVNY